MVWSRLGAGWVATAGEPMTSIGEADVVTVRSVRRVPVMTIWSLLTAVGLTGCAALAASVTNRKDAEAADARSKGLNARMRELVMKFPRTGWRANFCCA